MIGKVVLFLTLVCYVSAAVGNCKQAGDYCQNHWDCCSNTCLNYLYKCSKVPKKAPASGVLQTVLAPAPIIATESASLDSLLQVVFAPANSGRDLNAIESRLGEDAPEEKEPATVSTSTTTAPNSESTTTGPKCSEIGSKCYTNEECCTLRCHGFLHQCVT